jgi:hypothetical protein
MDNKTFILALRKIIREELKTVIKQELTEILKEGLKPTISEMTQPAKTSVATNKKPMFEDNKWASVLNETEALSEQQPSAMNSLSDMMNESYNETITMTSKDAVGFGMMRQNMAASMGLAPQTPKVMEDPETGKTYEVAPEVAAAMTRDYSALMSAINKKKGN